jgi:phage terminase large subunit
VVYLETKKRGSTSWNALARDSPAHTEGARLPAEAEDAPPVDCRDVLLTPPAARPAAYLPLLALLEACRHDPARFQAEFLGRTLWSKQIDVCRAIADSPVTVVPAGRAVGKSFLLAGIVLWWLYTRPHSLVITTGPDHRQVVSVLWKELRRALQSARVPLGHDHLTRGYSSPQRLIVKQGTGWGALGFAAQYEEGFSGQHAGDLLVIVDEASGVTAPIWSAIHGLAAARLVVAGNPIRYDCHFRELFDHAQKDSGIITAVAISSLESPDAHKDFSPVGMASRSFLHQMRAIHGEESPWWRSNILGIFPGQETVRFIPAAWLDACTRADVPGDELWKDYPAGSTFMGIDIGGGVGGDRSVILVRNQKQLLAVFASEWHGVLDDARQRLEPIVVQLARQWNVSPDHIVYDKAGIGRSFGSYLANHGLNNTMGFFGAGRGGKLYINRRTANAFALKRRLDPHRDGYVPFYCGGIAEWPELRQELAELRSPTMEVEESQVKQVLEDKDALAARLHRSPDLLDALLMTFTYLE